MINCLILYWYTVLVLHSAEEVNAGSDIKSHKSGRIHSASLFVAYGAA